MAQKRKYDEIDNIDELDKPMSSTRMHGAIVALSPVKKGRKPLSFEGTLADQTSKVEIKCSRYGEGYEVMVKTTTHTKESPKEIDVPSLKAEMSTSPTTITLDSLPDLEI